VGSWFSFVENVLKICFFALVGPESSSSNTVASTADHSDQPGKNPLKYSAVAGNWTRATGRTDSELSHWAIMTRLSWGKSSYKYAEVRSEYGETTDPMKEWKEPKPTTSN